MLQGGTTSDLEKHEMSLKVIIKRIRTTLDFNVLFSELLSVT